MNKKVNIIILSTIALFVIVGVVYYANINLQKFNPNTDPIKIGLIGHFSGEYANYGLPMKKAIELAVEEINVANGIDSQKIELIIEDDNGDANNAAAGMNKLATIDNLDYIISAQASGATSIITPIARDNKKVLIITLASAPNLTKDSEYIFRPVPSDDYQANKIAEFINTSLESDKVAGLYVNDAYGIGIKEIINQKANSIISEMFEAQAVDYKTQLLKIKESKADTLVITARSEEFPIILKQINELGMDMKIIASETFKDENVLKDSGQNAENVYVAFMADPRDYVNFSNKYEAKFNEGPSAYSMYAYDGFYALAKAIDQAGNDKEKVKSALLNIFFDGASGKFGFDNNRERTGTEYIMYQVRDGQFVQI